MQRTTNSRRRVGPLLALQLGSARVDGTDSEAAATLAWTTTGQGGIISL